MEENGNALLIKFIKETKEGISNFDNFTVLEELSQNKINKKTIVSIFKESNNCYIIIIIIIIGIDKIQNEVKDVKNL